MYSYDHTEENKNQSFVFATRPGKDKIVLSKNSESPGTESSVPEVRTELRELEPTTHLVYDKAIKVLQSQELRGKFEGVTIAEIQDLTGLGYSVIRKRLLILLEQGKLNSMPGDGRRPAYYFLPHQYLPPPESTTKTLSYSPRLQALGQDPRQNKAELNPGQTQALDLSNHEPSLEKENSKESIILQLIASEPDGITAPAVGRKLNLPSRTVNEYLQKLMDLNLINRVRKTSKKAYLYFLIPGLTKEQVNTTCAKLSALPEQHEPKNYLESSTTESMTTVDNVPEEPHTLNGSPKNLPQHPDDSDLPSKTRDTANFDCKSTYQDICKEEEKLSSALHSIQKIKAELEHLMNLGIYLANRLSKK